MQKTNVKRNLLLILVTLAAIIAFGLAFVFARAPRASAEAGNNAGSAMSDGLVKISLDVNGMVQPSGNYDNTSAALEANNAKKYSRRNISGRAAINGQFDYYFVRNTIQNEFSAFLSVDVRGGEDEGTHIVVEAIAMPEVAHGYFSVAVKPDGSDSLQTINFEVTITDSFVQGGEASRLYVGSTVSGGAETSNSLTEDGSFASITTFDNYSKATVNLGTLLKGRALYKSVDGVYTPLNEEADSTRWTVKSVTNLKINSVSFPEISGLSLQDAVSSCSVRTPSNSMLRIEPYISGKVAVSSDTIRTYNAAPENHGKVFWNEVHIMEVNVVGVNEENPTPTRLIIPFKFAPANPQKKVISSSILRLNVTSGNTYDLTRQAIVDRADPEDDSSDYSAIYVKPNDLMEYSAPDTYVSSYFTHTETKLNGSNDSLKTTQGIVVERIKIDEETGALLVDEDADASPVPPIYRITGKKSSLANSNYEISFSIRYFTGTTSEDAHDYTTSINITTYGGYEVKFSPINGKKAVSYNVLNSSVFTDMRERGYLLTGARSLNTSQLGVTFSNNVLTLTPKVDAINGQAEATVWLEFTNNSRQVIEFESAIIDINVNAGSLFSRFDDWEAWLIIAACIVGGIIILLIIAWLFIRALSKKKQDELAMQAPVSSYIVKLNSTIAQTQAQQRMAQTQALSQMGAQMLLGAGPATGSAPIPDTLQLATGIPSQPGAAPSFSQPGPATSEPQTSTPPEPEENLEELIAKYITDDELLERIFTEKYEPKGMVRRTFFKSKDLQARELDKEKKRIIERYKTPMPMDEAIMSEAEIKKAAATPSMSGSEATMSEPQEVVDIYALDFDPNAPLYVEEPVVKDEFSEEKIDIEVSPEESKLKELEHRSDVLAKELAELEARLAKVGEKFESAKNAEQELREKIAKAEQDDAQYAKDIEDLEFKLASAKNKDKPTITRDIGIKEEKKKRNAEELENLRAELERLLGSSEKLASVQSELTASKDRHISDRDALAADLEKAKAEFEAYLERMEKVRKRQELEAKVTTLTPLLEAVDNTDYELKRLDKLAEKQGKEREALKSTVAQAKSQILGATDFGVIADLNAQISDANARLSELEREITKNTKKKSDLQIEFNSQRRKANDFIEKNDIPLEDVIRADDRVLGAIEFDIAKARREQDKEDAEKAVAAAQAVYDDLAASDSDVTMIAMEVASQISELEEELTAANARLEEINSQMDIASEDEKLDLMVQQGDTSDKIEELKTKLEQANIDGTKRKMEAQAEYDSHLEEARTALDNANEDFRRACSSFDEFVNNTDPLDLIISGSGIISQDQKKFEAENLKKQLERSKLEAEQARMAAQQAQEAADEARRRAAEESEEARLEAERTAQEAIERAEKARQEAEEKAKADVEAAERARQEAQDALAAEAEEAKRRAQEETEEARRQAMDEAEEAKRQAMGEAEEAKRKAEEEAAEAKRKAEEEAEEAKRRAQEEIEEMKRKADEEAEAKRLEEENKRKEDEARQKAEAERAEAIAKKIALRRDQIIAIRNEMKDLQDETGAKNLRERLYNLQLTFDEDEKGSSELMDFYNKTMDDIQSAGEIARLKAENAKKPQRVVRKVTERVNRIPRKKGARPGARPAARPGARPASRAGARPAARPGARPAARPGARPGGARPGARPGGNRPTRPR